MEILTLPVDINVFGFAVSTFPHGVGEAFDVLTNKTGDRAGERNYYGLSEFREGKMGYYALAEEKFSGEAEKYNCEKLKIDKGDYLTATVNEWRKKIDCIKDVFYEIIQDARADKTKPAIEWYKNDKELICMVKINK